MKKMIVSEDAYSDGSLSGVSKALVDSMIRHIRHEEDVVYPKIEEALSLDDDLKLIKKYEHFNADFGPDFARLGEEFAVKSSNSFNDQYDLMMADGHIRRQEGSYRGTCRPAWF